MNQVNKATISGGMDRTERWPMGSQDMEFDMCTEMRRATVALIRGDKPRNLLGLLMVNHEPIAVDDVAQELDKPIEEIEWIIEQLEEEDLCERITRDGVTKVYGFAAFSARNAP